MEKPTTLFEKVWNLEQAPSGWLKGVITKVEKKEMPPSVKTTEVSYFDVWLPKFFRSLSSQGYQMAMSPFSMKVNVNLKKIR